MLQCDIDITLWLIQFLCLLVIMSRGHHILTSNTQTILILVNVSVCANIVDQISTLTKAETNQRNYFILFIINFYKLLSDTKNFIVY